MMTGGTMVAVVGASGVGKDSVMAAARARLAGRADIGFVRRLITRPADAGGEDHLPVDADAFGRLAKAGAFCVHWHAHGLDYGLPAAAVADVRAGRTLVANGSRAALPDFARVFPALVVVRIVAEPAVLEARLVARGRESAADIRERLAGADAPLPPGFTVVDIDNSGRLEVAATAFADLLGRLAAAQAAGTSA